MATSNRQLIKKDGITTSDITGSNTGVLNPEQADKFIDYMVESIAFLGDIRTVSMGKPLLDLDFIGIASRIIRKGVEATAPTYQPGIVTDKKQLQTTEVILPQDVSLSFLEDNIEKGGAEDHIARLLATQFANDMCDLTINGDTTATGTDEDFLTIGDGLIKLAKGSSNTHKFDTNSSDDYKGVVFPGMLALMPEKFKRDKSKLRFYCAPSVAEGYIDQLSTRQTARADELIETGVLPKYKGITVYPVEYFPAGAIVLTMGQNIATGVQRTFTWDRERVPRKRIVEFTITARVDPCKIVHDPALVIGYDVA